MIRLVVYTWKAHVACNFNCLIETEGHLRSQNGTYTADMVIP